MTFTLQKPHHCGGVGLEAKAATTSEPSEGHTCGAFCGGYRGIAWKGRGQVTHFHQGIKTTFPVVLPKPEARPPSSETAPLSPFGQSDSIKIKS